MFVSFQVCSFFVLLVCGGVVLYRVRAHVHVHAHILYQGWWFSLRWECSLQVYHPTDHNFISNQPGYVKLLNYRQVEQFFPVPWISTYRELNVVCKSLKTYSSILDRTSELLELNNKLFVSVLFPDISHDAIFSKLKILTSHYTL